MEKFSIEEIRNYLKTQDSFGDALYNLSEANIKIANIPDELIYEDDNTDFNFIENCDGRVVKVRV